MTELYPSLRSRELIVLGSGGDATKVCSLGGGCDYYFWLDRWLAVRVTGLLDSRGKLIVDGGTVPVAAWTLSPPYLHLRVVESLEEYASWLARRVGRRIEGRRIVLGFSGGKDSMAALLVLLALQEHVGFRLHPVYVHIPFLESPRSVSFVERVSRKLGVWIDIREAPRREMKSLLKWKGLPRRGYRWCTAYKAKPMRRIRKEDRRSIEVVADRLTESPKRLLRLSKAAASEAILVGRVFRPTYILSLLDVASIVRRAGLIHPDYLEGAPRVACHICPFKALHEYCSIPPLEDPGLVEEALKRTWAKWYYWASYEDFVSQHLWRFDSWTARSVYRARRALLGRGVPGDALTSTSVEEDYRYIWTEPLPETPIVPPWDAARLALRAWRARKPIAAPATTIDYSTRPLEY